VRESPEGRFARVDLILWRVTLWRGLRSKVSGGERNKIKLLGGESTLFWG
jgi:hypothetical protein